MTRQIPNVAASRDPGKPTLLQPLRPPRNLMEEVVARIAGEIRSGRLAPGARLPTEQKLMQAMGVSRTVVREAVAALRAEGLVTTRQGSGAFVSADTSRVPFRIDPDGLDLDRACAGRDGAAPGHRGGSGGTCRGARDAAGAGLQSRRRCATWRLPSSVARARSARTSPCIAPSRVASGNPRFAELLRYLGGYVIPRQSVRVSVDAPEQQRQLSDGHPEGACPHLRGHRRPPARRRAQGHARAPDQQPQALPAPGGAATADRSEEKK